MKNKSTITFNDVKNYNYQGILVWDFLDMDEEVGRKKFLLATSKVDNNNIININEVAIKYANGRKEILFSNFSLTKAIEFYNNLK